MAVTWLENSGLVAIAHERELCQLRPESKRVLAFEDEGDELGEVENAKGLWDTKRVAGTRHTDGALRHIAAKRVNHHRRMKVESSADLAANTDHLTDLMDMLDAGAEIVQRFYLIRIQETNKERDVEKPVAILVMKYDLSTRTGAQAMGACYNLGEEGVLYMLRMAHLREDRVPMGNISKAITATFNKEEKV